MARLAALPASRASSAARRPWCRLRRRSAACWRLPLRAGCRSSLARADRSRRAGGRVRGAWPTVPCAIVPARCFPLLYSACRSALLLRHARGSRGRRAAPAAAADRRQRLGAVLHGRAFGRRPLAPAISPKKTVEGAIGGFVVRHAGRCGRRRAGGLPDADLPLRVLLGVADRRCSASSATVRVAAQAQRRRQGLRRA